MRKGYWLKWEQGFIVSLELIEIIFMLITIIVWAIDYMMFTRTGFKKTVDDNDLQWGSTKKEFFFIHDKYLKSPHLIALIINN
jgi:predicted permease